jgi:hypothetical protein
MQQKFNSQWQRKFRGVFTSANRTLGRIFNDITQNSVSCCDRISCMWEFLKKNCQFILVPLWHSSCKSCLVLQSGTCLLQVLMAVSMSMLVLWVVTPSGLQGRHQYISKHWRWEQYVPPKRLPSAYKSALPYKPDIFSFISKTLLRHMLEIGISNLEKVNSVEPYKSDGFCFCLLLMTQISWPVTVLSEVYVFPRRSWSLNMLAYFPLRSKRETLDIASPSVCPQLIIV